MEFTKHEIAERINRPVGTIKHWTDRLILTAEQAPARGKGFARLYSFRNLIEAAIIDYMNINLEVSLDIIKDVLNIFRQDNYLLNEAINLENRVFGINYEVVVFYDSFKSDEKRTSNAEYIFLTRQKDGSLLLGDEFEHILKDKIGMSVFKMGRIRNEAMRKYRITWADNARLK